DHGRVEVAVGVDLGAAEESVVDHAALASFHDICHAGGHAGAVEGARIADADRHGRQLRRNAAGLEADDKLRRVSILGEHGRGARDTCAYRDAAAVLQDAGGAADHQLHGVVANGHGCAAASD